MKTRHVLRLLELLAEKENQALDRSGFGRMSEAICDSQKTTAVDQRYLYDWYRKVQKLLEAGVETCNPQKLHMDIIAKHLGYPAFRHYESQQDSKVSRNLASCVGNWWSYVRANSGEVVFKTPVSIQLDPVNQIVSMEFRSKSKIFKGIVSEDSSCLTTLLDSGEGKKLGLVFKIGNTSMKVLQGVFCGISSAGEPIAGREILVRETDLSYEEMKWELLSLNDPTVDERIRTYFSEHTQNCIKIRGVSSFGWGDLDNSKPDMYKGS